MTTWLKVEGGNNDYLALREKVPRIWEGECPGGPRIPAGFNNVRNADVFLKENDVPSRSHKLQIC